MTDERAPRGTEAEESIGLAKDIFDEHSTMTIATVDGGDPWIAKVFFVEDEPMQGCLDLCCSLLLSSRKLALIRANQTVAFVIAGDTPDRWVQGTGRAELVEDEADGAAIFKRLEEKSAAAGPFLSRMPSQPVRIHVARMKLTDVTRKPPIVEFSFD